MSNFKKLAALGAAAAISATGLVAAAGAANAATPGQATYTCTGTGTMANLLSGPFDIPVTIAPATLSSLASGVTAGKGSPIAGSADLSQFLGALTPTGAGVLGQAGTLSATSAFPVSLGSQTANTNIVGAPMTAAELQSSHTLTFTGSLVAPASAVGTHAASLPSSFSLAVSSENLGPAGTVECSDNNTAELSLGNLTVKPASAGGSTGTSNAKALAAAKAQLAKDTKKLAQLKKALEKASKAKKKGIKKQIVKVTKAIKADQAKIASLSK